jgi:hypothetical protein
MAFVVPDTPVNVLTPDPGRFRSGDRGSSVGPGRLLAFRPRREANPDRLEAAMRWSAAYVRAGHRPPERW